MGRPASNAVSLVEAVINTFDLDRYVIRNSGAEVEEIRYKQLLFSKQTEIRTAMKNAALALLTPELQKLAGITPRTISDGMENLDSDGANASNDQNEMQALSSLLSELSGEDNGSPEDDFGDPEGVSSVDDALDSIEDDIQASQDAEQVEAEQAIPAPSSKPNKAHVRRKGLSA